MEIYFKYTVTVKNQRAEQNRLLSSKKLAIKLATLCVCVTSLCAMQTDHRYHHEDENREVSDKLVEDSIAYQGEDVPCQLCMATRTR